METKVRSGIPMDEKSFEEWQQAFRDIEESIENLYKEKEKPEKSNKK